MLNQAIQWVGMVGTVIEGVLLARLLMLKLHRVYLFVTLYWAVSVIFDAAAWAAGIGSRTSDKLSIYWLFVAAIVFPLAAWDAFEQAKTQIAKIRRLHAPRLVSGLLITSILGFVCSLSIDDQVVDGISASTYFIGLFLWLGSACASLLYMWNVNRMARKQNVAFTRNTAVWIVVFMLTFGRSIVECGFVVAAPLLNKPASEGVDLFFRIFDLAVAVWCLLRLRGLPSDATPEPANISL